MRFQMCPQITFAFVGFFSFIICVSEGNIFIDPTFNKVIIYKILIHHLQFGIVVPAYRQFETEKMKEEITDESESHC